MPDYKELLMHYMAHVMDIESVSFVEGMAHGHDFPEGMQEQLEAIEVEVRARFP